MLTHRDLHGTTALVTGGNRGIGRAIVALLLGEGVQVLATGRDTAALADLAAAHAGAPLTTAVCDLAEPGEIEQLFAVARTTFVRLDLLVNNAGLGIYGPATDLRAADFDLMMAVNARAALLCAQHAFRWMQETGGGRIVNISSVVGHKGYVNQVGYAASKHALLGITKVLAREGQAHGIRCSAICPGGVATDLIRQARPDLDPAGLIQPEDVARAVWYLATEPETVATDCLELRRAGGTPFA
jgi:3-oxoacyl-[acyl-carrier protein] reductase